MLPSKNVNDNKTSPLWMEHRTSDGKVYYSDPITKETTWDKPPGAKIVPYNPQPAGMEYGGGGERNDKGREEERKGRRE